MPRRLAAIMFTDVAGYTELAQADEAGALRLLKEQDRIFRPILEAHRGRRVKTMGDGQLVQFANALDGVECAIDLQRRVHEHNSRRGVVPLRIRIGLHVGDVQSRGADILGDAVNIASRIEPLASPGEVCLSEPVYIQVHNKIRYPLERLGPRNLKGVREPMEVYRIVFPWATGDVAVGGALLPRIAVLPLANISPNPKDEYFADGLTEELISVLSQIRGLRVIARTSVGQYKGTTKPIKQIGSELGVSSILEGSVRKAGDQIRITIQLIDVTSEEHRIAQTYDRRMENVFAIQAEVAERTAGELKVELLKSERESIEETPTSNLVAYESYLRGMEAFRRVISEAGKRVQADQEAVACFEGAIREDPGFSAAYSHLANHLLGVMGITRPAREVIPRARELVARALDLNPVSSDAHTARGNLAFQVDHDWKRAEAELQQAISLNPSSSSARCTYGFLLSVLQRFTEAQKQYLAAIEVDPLWLLPRLNLINVYESSGELGTAVAEWQKLRTKFPESEEVRFGLAFAYALSGQGEPALELIEPLARATDIASRRNRAAVLALLGRPDEAVALLKDWEVGKLTAYLSLVRAAQFCALVGEKEKAISLLEQDDREGDRELWCFYKSVPFDSIRDDVRFKAMLRAMNLPERLVRRPRLPNHDPAR